MDNPAIGDTAHVKAATASVHAGAYGLVRQIRYSRTGQWIALELLLGGERLWFDRESVDYVLQARNPFRRRPGKVTASCRLYGILAREAPAGLIVRRRPTGGSVL
ncbi:MAG: hypothetical protein M1401_09150 [Chloroflexi bacterium]|nr:hypothetical protein [Chloroflexota bacterium]